MNKVKAMTLALPVLVLASSAISFQSHAVDKSVESRLIRVCKAAKSGNLYNYVSEARSVHLSDQDIALKVMCNGDDIISFAEKHGAQRTAGRLESSLGNVNITDVAAISKVNVNFEE